MAKGEFRLDYPAIGADVHHAVLVVIAGGRGYPQPSGEEGFRPPLRELLAAQGRTAEQVVREDERSVAHAAVAPGAGQVSRIVERGFDVRVGLEYLDARGASGDIQGARVTDDVKIGIERQAIDRQRCVDGSVALDPVVVAENHVQVLRQVLPVAGVVGQRMSREPKNGHQQGGGAESRSHEPCPPWIGADGCRQACNADRGMTWPERFAGS
ncbi:hypothetical protein D3C80_1401390 [compost metagenome]